MVLLLFPFIRGQGQSTQSSIIWLRTENSVTTTFMLESEDNYFLGALSDKLDSNGNFVFDDVSFSSYIYKTDKNLVVEDSVHFDYQGDDRHFIFNNAFLLDNGQILLCGSGYIPKLKEHKLGLRWITTSLEIVRDTMISIDNFNMGTPMQFLKNHDGNFLTYGHRVRLDPNEKAQLYFIEFDQEGIVLNKVIRTFEVAPNYISLIKDGKYHMFQYKYHIVQLNSNFTLDETFELDLPPYYHMWSLIPYTEDSYFLTGEYNANFMPEIIDTDLAYMQINNTGNILNIFRYGYEWEPDKGPCLSFYDPDTLYVGGTRNWSSYAIDSTAFSTVFIHKINLQGDILRTTYFKTNHLVYAVKFFATSDGGCLIGGFESKLDTSTINHLVRDGFFIKMEADGSILGLPESWEYTQNREFQVFPNPVKDKLQIVSTNGKSMDYTRGILYNSSGIQLKSFEFRAETVQDLSDLAAGIYMLQLIKQNGSFETVKLIVNPGN